MTEWVWPTARVARRAGPGGLLSVVALGLLLAGLAGGVGCGGKEEKPVVSVFTMEYTARTSTDWKELEKRFNETRRDFQVAVTVADWGSAQLKLRNLIKEETPPDLATLPAGWLLEEYGEGRLAPLDELADEAFLARFHPAALRTGVIGGRRYGLPFGFSVRFLYVNDNLLSAVQGEESLAVPTTWEELLQAARAVQAIPDAVREERNLPAQSYGFGLPLSSEEAPLTFAYFLWTAGGRFFDDSGDVAFDSSAGREALTFLVEMAAGGEVTNPEPSAYGLDTLEALFRTEKLGLVISGHWLRGELLEQRGRVRFGFGPLPVKVQPVAPAACDYLVMFATGEQRQRAWQFVDFLYRPENRKGFFDPQKGRSVIPELSASLEAMPAQRFWQQVRSSLEVARFMPLEPDWPKVSILLAKEIAAAAAGEKSPEEALAAAAKAAQALIDARRAAASAKTAS